ncbi:MBL fold metallo-hydrolase [Chryseobacterium nematophagum]|uniref:MBL fold metallo-hydrolase n=1 Tax=Chryseobacterium nematophagum TaxID=2305228 RepID=A0A3M7TLR9_9FLAO|nr:MBL fold metallo-hydrolase [Chryseobacterium nematophagum]RNA63529.1 MBL fold metallo-hydrolase [Chryseobacterium nematophagum]
MWINKIGTVQDNLTILGTPSNPIYLIKGQNEYALVEAGLTRDATLVLSQIEGHVSDLGMIKHWFITHSHYDHCGTIEYLYPYLSKVKLYASENAIRNFQNEKYVKKIREFNTLISDKHTSEFSIDLQQIPFVTITDNQQIETEVGTWKVLATPGHSPCSVSLYHKESDILFVSDSLGEIIGEEKWFPLAFDHVGQFIESINKLKLLQPNIIALGHNGVLTGVDAHLAPTYSLQGYHDFVKLIADLHNTISSEQLVDLISEKYKVTDHSFIPDSLYRKSIEILLSNLIVEELI